MRHQTSSLPRRSLPHGVFGATVVLLSVGVGGRRGVVVVGGGAVVGGWGQKGKDAQALGGASLLLGEAPSLRRTGCPLPCVPLGLLNA